MDIRNNNLNFTANMVRDKSVKDRRWNCIALEVERQTQNSPEYEIRLFQEDDKFEVYIDRGRRDDLSTRSFLLSREGSEALSKLSDQSIAQKFKKMLNLVKAHDKVYDNLPDDIAKLEKKYGVEFDQGTYDRIAHAVYSKVETTASNKIWDDAVLSDAETSIIRSC